MTTSSEIPRALADRLEQEIESPDGQIRYDIVTLLAFRDGMDRCNPISLFWDVWEPRVLTISNGGVDIRPAPALPDQIEEMVLDYLERLYERHRVPYEPDADDEDIKEFYDKLPDYYEHGSEQSLGPLPIPPKLKNLVTFLHVAAARAFRIKASQGGTLSEEAIDCLREVERTLYRLQRVGGDVSPHTQGFQISAWAVAARVFVELSRACRREGRYADALRYLARAVTEYDEAVFIASMEEFTEYWPSFDPELWSALPSYVDSIRRVRTRLIEGMSNSKLRDQISTLVLDATHEYPRLSEPTWKLLVGNRFFKGLGFADISPQESATAFVRLQSSGEADSWRQVAKNCDTLAGCEYLFSIEGRDSATGDFGQHVRVKDEEGYTRTWHEFWDRAALWLKLQLSPNEYRQQREEDKKTESEDRLKSYFFGRNWSALPELTRRRLINADRTWCSKEILAVESVLNDLQRATEAACNEFVWRPLENNTSGRAQLLEFLQFKMVLKERGRDPSTRDYIRVCEARYYKDFLKNHNLLKEDERFLVQDLPAVMRQLADARNRAEHEVRTSFRRTDVEPFFKAFLGIGQRGVLPELVRIGRRLRSN